MVLNANIRALNSHAESLTCHRWCSITHACVCLFHSHQNMDMLRQTNCFSFTSGYAHIQSTLSTSYLLVSRKTGRKGNNGMPCFPLYGIILSVSGWPTQESHMNKKGYDKFPWLSVFLRIPLPFSLAKGTASSHKKHSLCGLCPNLIVAVTGLPCSHWSLSECPGAAGAPPACAQGAL